MKKNEDPLVEALVVAVKRVYDSRFLGDDMEHLTSEERLAMLHEIREIVLGY
jgi:hypothetical protein